MAEEAPKRKKGRIFRIALLLILLVGLGLGGYGYYVAFTDNVNPPAEGEEHVLLIPDGADYQYVFEELKRQEILKSPSSFDMVASIRKYDQLVKKGRYVINPGTNTWDLVGKLRSGAQDGMKISFLTYRTPDRLAEAVAAQLSFSKEDFLQLLTDEAFLQEQGFSTKTIMGMFLPDTYEVYWTIGARDFFDRMRKEYDSWWTAARKAKAKELNFSTAQVSTLASIVQAETYITSERPTVAGLYLNRLRDGWPLQADPTVIFAVGDFTIKRVLKKHLETESPYNTYKNTGLPPGPINNPEKSSLEAVLSPESHSYFFMCAKCDLSGHNFSKTSAQHERYARQYRQCLNKKKIFQ